MGSSTKYIIYNDEITGPSIESLINDIQESVMAYDKIKLFFSSIGGEVAYALILLDFLNEYSSHVEICAFGEVSSCAFDLTYFNKCATTIMPGTVAIIHKADIKTSFTKPNPFKETLEFYRDYLETTYNYGFLNKEEKKLYDKGEDVRINYKRLLEIFNSKEDE